MNNYCQLKMDNFLNENTNFSQFHNDNKYDIIKKLGIKQQYILGCGSIGAFDP